MANLQVGSPRHEGHCVGSYEAGGVCYNSARATDPKPQGPPQGPTPTPEQPAKPKLVFPAHWIDRTADAVAAGEIIVMVPAPRRGRAASPRCHGRPSHGGGCTNPGIDDKA